MMQRVMLMTLTVTMIVGVVSSLRGRYGSNSRRRIRLSS
jgi:hypothetical protein